MFEEKTMYNRVIINLNSEHLILGTRTHNLVIGNLNSEQLVFDPWCLAQSENPELKHWGCKSQSNSTQYLFNPEKVHKQVYLVIFASEWRQRTSSNTKKY